MTIDIPASIENLVLDMLHNNIDAFLVGGTVRDALAGIDGQDFDFELFSSSPLTMDDIAAVASCHGKVDAVGKSFGIVKLHLPDGLEVDLAMPRKETKTGQRHGDFTVEFDATMSFDEASSRRDFTVNAIYFDPLTGDFIDAHGGIQDMSDKILRPVSDAFDEDPLRVLRAAQFISRFGFTASDELVQRSIALAGQFSSISAERVANEMMKLLKGAHVADGIAFLHTVGWAELIGVKRVDDAAVERVSEASHLAEASRLIILGALVAGDALAFKRSMTASGLVHNMLLLARQERLPATVGEMRMRAHGAFSLEMIGLFHGQFAEMELAREVGVLFSPEAPWVTGSDILADHPGRKPGPWVGEMLLAERRKQAFR